MWPNTAAAMRQYAPGRLSNSTPAMAGMAPFIPSRTNTATPQRVPITRATFDAPGFPDPTVVMSMPRLRATMAALGNVPTA